MTADGYTRNCADCLDGKREDGGESAGLRKMIEEQFAYKGTCPSCGKTGQNLFYRDGDSEVSCYGCLQKENAPRGICQADGCSNPTRLDKRTGEPLDYCSQKCYARAWYQRKKAEAGR